MRRIITIIAALLALVAAWGAKPQSVKNTFEKPDFAFPETVEKHALPIFDDAIAARDGDKAIRAAIQLTVARDRISHSNYAKSLECFRRISSECGEPYASLAKLLEAEFYNQIYQDDQWQYDRRTLPLDTFPADVTEWSGDMFSITVRRLVAEAAAGDGLAKIPLANVVPILQNYKDAVKAGFSVADFIDIRGAQIVSAFSKQSANMLPFTSKGNNSNSGIADKSANSMCLHLIGNAISRHINDANANGLAFLYLLKYGYLPDSRREEFLKQCVDSLKDTPNCSHLLVLYANTIENDKNPNSARRERLSLYDDYLKRFPEAPGVCEVKNERAELLQESVSLTFKNQILPGKGAKANYEARNIYDFHVLIYECPGNVDSERYSQTKVSQFVNGRMPVASVRVQADSVVPDIAKGEIGMPALNQGRYLAVISRNSSSAGVINRDYYVRWQIFNVSGITYRRDGKERLYIVDGVNGAPVAGATVKFYNESHNKPVLVKSAVTDADGYCQIPSGDRWLKFTAEKDGNICSSSMWLGNEYDNKEKTDTLAKILTDRSIYKPGEKIGFTAVVWKNRSNTLSPVANHDFKAMLYDANDKMVDSVKLTTDADGRFHGEFTVPRDGLLGTYSVALNYPAILRNDRWYNITSTSVEVADYKSPTFYVELTGADGNVRLGDTVTLLGKARTYSGMPVAGAEVKYTVSSSMPWWWRFRSPEAKYGGKTVTDEKGEFKIVLATADLKGSPYERGCFTVQADVTDAAGETRQSPSAWFSTVVAYAINPEMPERVDASETFKGWKVSAVDAMGHPAKKTIYYRIKNSKEEIVEEGSFESPLFKPVLESFDAGGYNVLFSFSKEFEESSDMPNVERKIVIYRVGERRPPVETALWVPVKSIVTDVKAGGKVKITVGSSYKDSWLLVETADTKHIIDRRWVQPKGENITIDVPAPADNSRIYVTVSATRDLTSSEETVTVIPAEQARSLEVGVETFRDRIEPGARESWKFRFSVKGKPMANIPVMAVMTNKALNALNPFSWSFNPVLGLYWNNPTRIDFSNPTTMTISGMGDLANVRCRMPQFNVPDFDTYGQSLYGRYYGGADYMVMNEMSAAMPAAPMGNIHIRDSRRVMKRAATVESAMDYAAKEESAFDEEVAEAGSANADGGNGSSEKEEVQLRQVECPLAFFKPDLHTDGNGVATVDFDAPLFVGTWQFQIAGYTPDMLGTAVIYDAVAAKSVMAQMNAPRFLRYGDNAQISATLFNNTDKQADLSGRIEVFDPTTGMVLASEDFAAENVAADGSRTVTMSFAADMMLSQLGIRAYAYSGSNSDGEQTFIPLYPSSTPVTESTTFYLHPGSATLDVKLPKYGKNSKVTLTYCDNPVWECVTALPSLLEPKSVNALAQIEALYGNAVAAGLCRDYPELMKGILLLASKENAADSTLVSNLQKNADLKAVTLNNTPWVNDAEAETERMSQLVKYADKEAAGKSVASIVKTLKDTQRADGGWSWCPDMRESSQYITGRVLLYFGMLRGMGYLPKECDAMAIKAFAFCDRKLVEDWQRTTPRYFSVLQLLNYLYVKSSFPDVKATNGFGALEKLAISKIRSGWRDFDIYNKATAATLMSRRGFGKDATLILESLRQFASKSETKGMWYDNLNESSFSSFNNLITTAQVLEAYAEIEPKSPAVDGLRQWLLLQKQVQNWGDERNTCEVVHAILTTGTKWTSASETPVITLAGKSVNPGRIAALTGSFTVNLDASEASGKTLSVSKNAAGPSWGGVVTQYVAPIKDVKSASVPQLSIEKNVYAVTMSGKENVATTGPFNVGDRVKVTLTIKADRDLDYVAVLDSRAACLEPVEQISGYAESDGTWFYREVRGNATNIFIPYLTKGTHVINYECFVDRAGEYSLGISQAQSQYAPVISAHSKGTVIIVK